jgi:hypothetical protein
MLPASPAVLIGNVRFVPSAIFDAHDALDNTLCRLHLQHGKERSPCRCR